MSYRRRSFHQRILPISLACAVLGALAAGYAQERPGAREHSDSAEMSLRKSVNTREYQGQQVEGEERQIGRGDSLWRILVEEKGLPGQKFRSYLVVIRGLNPQIKNLDVLRIGDKIFIPLRADSAVEARARAESGAERDQIKTATTINYRVKAGEHLYQILREQLKLSEERKLAQYYALVKDLNPERKDWDNLLEGEIVRLPALGTSAQSSGTAETAAPAPVKRTPEPVIAVQPRPPPNTKPKPPAFDARQALRAPAKENMSLFTMVAEAMGGEVQQNGEEVVALKDGTVRFERSTYPVIVNPVLQQRLVVDPDGKIPASLKTKLNDPSIGTPVLPMANGLSIQDAVSQLLAGLGYQALPADRPVVIQEEGVALEAKGNWMVLAPQVNNKPQEVYVINLTDHPDEIPEYLKFELARKGLHLRDVVPPAEVKNSRPNALDKNNPSTDLSQIKTWPRDKQEIVDALLLAYGVTFGVAENLSAELGDGLRVDTRADRVCELVGQRTALFFRRTDPEVRKSLQDKQGIKTVELDLKALSTREMISRLLNLLGDQAVYREHRFSAADGSAPERLTVKAWGFQLTKKPMFITDRQIPPALHQFFFEKGLEIVYFQ